MNKNLQSPTGRDWFTACKKVINKMIKDNFSDEEIKNTIINRLRFAIVADKLD